MSDLKSKILDATNGGLDILLDLYPSAREVVHGSAKKFKMREEERTPSATIMGANTKRLFVSPLIYMPEAL